MEMDMISGTYLYAPGSKTKTKIGIFYLSTAPTITYSWKFVLVSTTEEDF